MKTFTSGLLCLALMATAATPALARTTGGALTDALGSALRHATADGSDTIEVQEGMVSAADPQTIITALQDQGYRAVLGTDSYGDPQVSTSAEGVDYTVDFYGCTDGANCDSVLFTVGFDLADGMSLEAINSWNSTQTIARSYLDDEMDPFLDMYVLTEAGVPADVFGEAIVEWTRSLADFIDYIDW